jgi:hypothetical protein
LTQEFKKALFRIIMKTAVTLIRCPSQFEDNEGGFVTGRIMTTASLNVLSHSHKGAAGMRSELTFVEVVWIVDARVER